MNDEEIEIFYVGDEDLNDAAANFIDSRLRNNETLIAVSGFDFEKKAIAITDQRVLIADKNDGIILNLPYDQILSINRDGRTLIIRSAFGKEHSHRFGKDQTVQELVEIAYRQKAISERPADRAHLRQESPQPKVKAGTSKQPKPGPITDSNPHIS